MPRAVKRRFSNRGIGATGFRLSAQLRSAPSNSGLICSSRCWAFDANACAEDTVLFLRQLHQHIRGPLTIVWDRGNIHDRASVVRGYLARHPEIVTERFPAYAPELNPEELVWQHTKYSRLSNFAANNTVVLRTKLADEFQTLSRQPELLRSFIEHTQLPLLL